MFAAQHADQPKPAPKPRRRRWNWVVSDILRKLLKYRMEWSAPLRGQRFYCRALGGESEYNLAIHCDLTVSCNCQDYDGSGQIGDLIRIWAPMFESFR